MTRVKVVTGADEYHLEDRANAEIQKIEETGGEVMGHSLVIVPGGEMVMSIMYMDYWARPTAAETLTERELAS